jgi:DNA-binding NarL/FixJ family response regulator
MMPVTPKVRTQIRVMLVDDHALVRAAVKQAICAPDVVVVAEAATAEEALVLAPRVQPDVMLVDITLPGMDGLDLVRELEPRLPSTKIVMLTVSTADADVATAVDRGALGFLTKDVPPDALLRAVRGAYRGDLVMGRQMAARLVHRLSERARRAPSMAAFGTEMTRREMEVLRLVSDGFTDREIADALTLSPRTVEAHVANVLRKLKVDNRREAGRRYRALA